jgi:hypothetical protein
MTRLSSTATERPPTKTKKKHFSCTRALSQQQHTQDPSLLRTESWLAVVVRKYSRWQMRRRYSLRVRRFPQSVDGLVGFALELPRKPGAQTRCVFFFLRVLYKPNPNITKPKYHKTEPSCLVQARIDIRAQLVASQALVGLIVVLFMIKATLMYRRQRPKFVLGEVCVVRGVRLLCVETNF